MKSADSHSGGVRFSDKDNQPPVITPPGTAPVQPPYNPALLLAYRDKAKARLAHGEALYRSPSSTLDRSYSGLTEAIPNGIVLHQNRLPPFPHPQLLDTVDRYLSYLPTFVSKIDAARAYDMSVEFSTGNVSMNQLEHQFLTDDSWHSRWLTDRLLSSPYPAILRSNPVVLLRSVSAVGSITSVVKKAASLVSALLLVKLRTEGTMQFRSNKVGKTSLSMQEYTLMFNRCVVPPADADGRRDSVAAHTRRSHICICYNGNWWALNTVNKDGVTLDMAEIEAQLTSIVKPGTSQGRLPDAPSFSADGNFAKESAPPLSSRTPRASAATLPGPAISALTWLPRNEWGQLRTKLTTKTATDIVVSIDNTIESMRLMESAMFVLVLSPESPSADSVEAISNIMMGNGVDRWADKSLSLIVCANGVTGLTGSAMEYDAYHLAMMANFIVRTAEELDDQPSSSLLPTVAPAIDTTVKEANLAAVTPKDSRGPTPSSLPSGKTSPSARTPSPLDQDTTSERVGTAGLDTPTRAMTFAAMPTRKQAAPLHKEASLGDMRASIKTPLQVSLVVPAAFGPHKLVWHSSPELYDAIISATATVATLRDQMEVIQMTLPFGSRQFYGHGIDGDSFVQLAVQLAYLTLYQGPCICVHAVEMDTYQCGRTQYIPAMTPLSLLFCRAAAGIAARVHSKQDVYELLMEAAREQMTLRMDAKANGSWYSHLLALDRAFSFWRLREKVNLDRVKWLLDDSKFQLERLEIRTEVRRRRIVREQQKAEQERLRLEAEELERQMHKKGGAPSTAAGKGKATPATPSVGTAPTTPLPPSTSEGPGTSDSPDPIIPDNHLLPYPLPNSPSQIHNLGFAGADQAHRHPLFTDEATFGLLESPMVRVVGIRPLEGVAMVALSPTATQGALNVVYTIHPQHVTVAVTSFYAAPAAQQFVQAFETAAATMVNTFLAKGKPLKMPVMQSILIPKPTAMAAASS